jgi:hypothetical protein
MSAYNWVEIERICPSCNVKSCIKCQTHFYSDYNSDESGRFHERNYKIGETMAWWSSSNPKHSEWRDSNYGQEDKYYEDSECCFSECLNCGGKLFVILYFKACSLSEVLGIGLEAQRNDSPIADMTQTFHQQNSSVIHINPNTIPSGINRSQFYTWRSNCWSQRATDF